MAMQARRFFYWTILGHRKQHWEAFLDNSDNISKIATYLDTKATASFAQVPLIATENRDRRSS